MPTSSVTEKTMTPSYVLYSNDIFPKIEHKNLESIILRLALPH